MTRATKTTLLVGITSLGVILLVIAVEIGFLLSLAKSQPQDRQPPNNHEPAQVQNFWSLNVGMPEGQKSKSWADVADTALTIGLSALIGGGIGIFGAWLSSRGEADKEYLKRKRELLEAILDQFDKFTEQQSTYWASLANAVYQRDKGDPNDPLAKADRDDLSRCELKLIEKYRLLIPCRSKLHLVGEHNAVDDLNKFKEVSDEFFKRANIENPNCTKQFLDESKAKMTEARHRFYDSLRAAYSRKTL